MRKLIILTILTFACIVAGFILAIFAYVNQSFTCLVLSLFAFLSSAYYATNLDEATKDGRKNN